MKPGTVRPLNRKQIKARRVGAHVLMDESALTAFIAANTVPARPGSEGTGP